MGPPQVCSAARTAASLHWQCLPAAFISSLGEGFLRVMYVAIASAPNARLIVAGPAGEPPVGFVAGTTDTRAMFRWLLPRHGLALGLRALPHLWLPSVSCRVAENGFYLARRSLLGRRQPGPQQPAPRAELLSLAVAPQMRHRGVARMLVEALDDFLQDRGCAAVRVVTDAADAGSNGFYSAIGWRVARQFTHHGRLVNEYVHDLCVPRGPGTG